MKQRMRNQAAKAFQQMRRLENQFSIIMWMMLLWLVAAWLLPLVITHLMEGFLPHRTGLFLNMHSVANFFRGITGLFIFLIAISVVMLLVLLALMVYYTAYKLKQKKGLGKRKLQCHKGLACRLSLLIFVFVFMLTLSVVSILDMGCEGSEDIETHAKVLRFIPYDKAAVQGIKMVAREAYMMGSGSDIPSDAPGATLVAANSTLAVPMSGAHIHGWTSTEIREAASAGNLKLDGAPVTLANSTTLGDMLYTYVPSEQANGAISLMTPAWAADHHTIPDDASIEYAMSREGVIHQELVGPSVVHTMLAAVGNNAPTDQDLVNKMKMDYFGPGVSLGYILYTQQCLPVSNFLTHKTSTVDVDEIFTYTHNCHYLRTITGGFFAAGLIIVVLFLVAVVVVSTLRHCRRSKEGYPNPYGAEPLYDRVPLDGVDAEDYERVAGTGEPDEWDDEWSDVSPMVNASAE